MKPRVAALLLGLAALHARPVRALDAAELKVYSPAVVKGERELEYAGFTSGQGPGAEQGYAFSAGYGFTNTWAAEVYEILHKDPNGPAVSSLIEVENFFQLVPQGLYWADLALLVETEIPQRNGDHGEVRAAPLIEKQIGPALLTLNLPFFWQFGPGYAPGTGLGYAARARYLLHPLFSPGLEAFGEPGVLSAVPDTRFQNHSVGPAILGSWSPAPGQRLRYSLAYLYGQTASSPGHTLVTRLEFEF